MKTKWLQAILLTFCTGGLLFLFYPSHSELGKAFVVASFYIMLRYAALVLGILLSFVWLFFHRKISLSFVFIFLTTLNLAICLSSVVLYFLTYANRAWLHDGLLNGLVGMAMLTANMLTKESKMPL